MATKKRAPRRRVSKKAPPAWTPAVEAMPAKSANLAPLLIVLGLGFAALLLWALSHRGPQKVPAPAVVPVAPQEAPAAAAKLPTRADAPQKEKLALPPLPAEFNQPRLAGARSDEAAAAKPSKPAEAPAAKAIQGAAPAPRPAPVQAAAAEPDGASYTFDRSTSEAFSSRCWRPAQGQATLEVFGPKNKKVRTLSTEAGPAGWKTLRWDGKDEAGAKVPGGLYYLRPSQPEEQLVRDLWVKG